MHSCGNTARKAEVGPTSGPTAWRLSHSVITAGGADPVAAEVGEERPAVCGVEPRLAYDAFRVFDTALP